MNRPVDLLSDAELVAINRKHTWVTATYDAKRRIVGTARPDFLFEVPERRVVIAQDKLGLKGKRVVEFGSLEGSHTIGLFSCGATVLALEARDENIAKTKERCRLYGFDVKVQKCDVENDPIPSADLFFHSGVLYHLQDPVHHLRRIAPLAPQMLLDLHHAAKADTSYVSTDGKTYPCQIYKEPLGGYKSGLRPISRWLPLDTLVTVLKGLYANVEVVRNEMERNGPRATLVCSR